MDTQRIRELLSQRDEIDEQIKAAVNGDKERKAQKCSVCGDPSHNARNCPRKPPAS